MPPSVTPDGRREIAGYTFARWTGADHDAFEQWIRDRRVERARRALARAPGLSPEPRERIVIEVAIRPVGIVDVLGEIRSHQACRFALKLALRSHHPDVTDPEIEAIEIGAGGILALMQWIIGLDAIAKPDATDTQEDPPDPPATTAPSDSPPSQPS